MQNTLINTYSKFLKDTFLERVQKISVNAGFTCPNRDGSKGVGGCTFCNNDSFNKADKLKTVSEQITSGMNFYKKKHPKLKKFIIYFQSYTNTYRPLSELKIIYEEALNYPEVIGLSIGTRPDCISDELIDYLDLLGKKYFISLEIGAESLHDKTLEKINRGHSVFDFEQTLKRCTKKSFKVSAHFMFGFPWETKEDVINSIKKISSYDQLDFIKIHQLQIVKDTAMSFEYEKSPFKLIEEDEYFEILGRIVANLNPKIVVQRLFSDYGKDFLISKSFEGNLTDINARFLSYLKTNNLYQGKFFN